MRHRTFTAQTLLLFALAGAYVFDVETVCSVPETLSDDDKAALAYRNCHFVDVWQLEVKEAIGEGLHEWIDRGEEQRALWERRMANASEACGHAAWACESEQDYEKCAWLAINAWGSIVRHGATCCTLLHPPYCMDQAFSASTVALLAPLAVLALLLAGAVLLSCAERPRKEPRGATSAAPAGGPRASAAPARARPGGAALRDHLEDAWQKRSCLRLLPNQAPFAKSTASLFAGLAEAFEFQEDNVKNQHEHLMSLWRSQLSMVADRTYDSDVMGRVDERDLLRQALHDLHAELLDGFERWRNHMRAAGAWREDDVPTRREEDGGVPTMCGAEWDPVRLAGRDEEDDGALSRKLAEVAAFLLVWGEAGNLRFMPEMLYFITDLVLSSAPMSPGEALYQPVLPSGESGLFLARVVRPVYNVVFDELYVSVDVKNQRDAKKLRDGFDAYLPGDVANYDDWNELFSDPARLREALVLKRGVPLFDYDHGQMFRLLLEVDWEVSLQARTAKTHNELHSLWGVFASTHRVCLLHEVMFLLSLCAVAPDPPAAAEGEWPVGGDTRVVRFAALGLLVPFHAIAWKIAEWHITGSALRPGWGKERCISFVGAVRDVFSSLSRDTAGRFCFEVFRRPPFVFFLVPGATWRLLLWARASGDEQGVLLAAVAAIHYTLSAYGLAFMLLIPSTTYSRFPFESTTDVPLPTRLVRYGFWFFVLSVKFVLGLIVIRTISDAIQELQISRPGQQSMQEIGQVYLSAVWADDVLLWTVLMCTTFALYLADTQLWFTVCCGLLGVAITFRQRHLADNPECFMTEDAVAMIPHRFQSKVLTYKKDPRLFGAAWDRIVMYMRYEDDISTSQWGDMSYANDAGANITWKRLTERLDAASAKSDALGDESAAPLHKHVGKRKTPQFFKGSPSCERCVQTYLLGVPEEFRNADLHWRIMALSRGLGLPLPRPYRAPYIPGITVLIPHYMETIILQRDDLYNMNGPTVPLIAWLHYKYKDEFEHFTERMLRRGDTHEVEWPVTGKDWSKYTPEQWPKVSNWATMRQQTLFRTVAGMCYYHPAIQAHFELQGDRDSKLAEVWGHPENGPSDVFTCLVSMQMYAFFSDKMLKDTEYMLEKFPSCLKIAFIDYEPKLEGGAEISDGPPDLPARLADGVHQRQKRRYYSCLIDKSCDPDGKRRSPKFRIELPGYPILGDGKGDNQNHAIPFTRGHYSQGIDANQGAYFEQMMLLPCALGEFRSSRKRILGFPEHITSDIGSVGDFAASAEMAFGTILQRTYAVLGARMHYGHPDIMNKLYMMQQGGVSKATKTLNLSEDIFAGIDFTLRGDGRRIKHCEYLHFVKGRDLGFNTVLGFFSKLSSGTGEQILTRQMFRLSQVLQLPEALTFYYAHAGYYLNQFIVSWSLPLLVWVWLLVLLSDCEDKLGALMMCEPEKKSSAMVMASALATCYSWLMLLFLFAMSFPLFAELWMQRNSKTAVWKMVQSYLTLSPLLFIFQSKCIGHYIVNEFRYGGAKYVATGRGLPTERRPFVGRWSDQGGSWEWGGLYLDYAAIAYYDGAMLFVGLAFVVAAGGIPSEALSALAWVFFSCALVLISWLGAPFIFNPYQYQLDKFKEDARALRAFFLDDDGRNWLTWYRKTQLKSGPGLNRTLVDIAFFGLAFIISAWYATVTSKIELLVSLFSEYHGHEALYATALLPPVFASLMFCLCAALLGTFCNCTSSVGRAIKAEHPAPTSGAASPVVVSPAIGKPLEGGGPATAPSPSSAKETASCPIVLPLSVTAVLVVCMDAAELLFALRDLHWVGWTNAWLAGVVLQLTLLSAAIVFLEGVVSSKAFGRMSGWSVTLAMPLETWVCAHRMARDILTSMLIFLPMGIFVALNSLNELLCPSFNLHQLCLYRDPGHMARDELEDRPVGEV